MSLLDEYIEKSFYVLDHPEMSEDEEEVLLGEMDKLWFAMTEKERDIMEDRVKEYMNSKRGR